MDSKKIGSLISSLRKERELTQAELAEILNVSNRTISKWENGDGFPDITLLPSIAAALGISVDELLAGEKAPGQETVDFKVTEVENKDNLLNFFKIGFVIAVFFALFAALLGTITELYCIWAFPILFYTHWEIMFVAVSLVAFVASGLVYSVGVTRLGISYNKSEMIAIAGKKGLLLSLILLPFPLSFVARIISCSRWAVFTLPVLAAIIIAVVILERFLYEKVK